MRKRTLLCTAAVVLFATHGALAQSHIDRGSPDRTPQAQGSAPSSVTNTPRNDQTRERGQPQAQAPQRQNGTSQPSTAQQQQPAQPSTAQQSTQPSTAQQPSNQPSTAQQQPSTTPGTAGTQQQPQAPSTAQQATPPANNQAAQPSTAPQNNQAAQPSQQPSTQQNANRQNGTTSGIVSLNTQQRTQVGQVIARTSVKPVTNVNFSLSVGTAVPRSVTVHALPADLVTIVPQYRGYSYFVVEEQVVIVEPSSHQIVAMVPYTGNRASASRTTQTRSVSLTNEQRNVVRKHATQRRASEPATTTTTRKRYSVGDEVDRTVTIETFPQTVYEEVPVMRRHRYFRDDDRVMLVDPDEDRIVDIIE